VAGRDNTLLCHAILTALGVPCHVVFDGDAGMEERKRQSVQHLAPEKRREKELEFERSAQKIREQNMDLLGYLGAPRTPQPPDESTARYTVFEDSLETYLAEHWPAWGVRRQELIDAGQGVDGKNAATYQESTRTAATDPPFLLHALLENVQTRAGRR
jgi:putative ATP-dependent endonuclease of OLD family